MPSSSPDPAQPEPPTRLIDVRRVSPIFDAALQGHAGAFARNEMERLSRNFPEFGSDPSLILLALTAHLTQLVTDLAGPADQQEADPLRHYEAVVRPVVERLSAALARGKRVLQVDLGAGFIGYNWHNPDPANGYAAWRWMAQEESSGMLIPRPEGAATLQIYGQVSHPAQTEELQLRLNGQVLPGLKRQPRGHFLNLTVPLPANDPAAQSAHPFGFLEITCPTRRHPTEGGGETRVLGFGVGEVQILRA